MYASGPPSYRKRARFTKRRFTGRRRYGSNRRGGSYQSSSMGNAGGIMFSRRRTSNRRVKNLMWNASVLSTHYRSTGSAALAIVSNSANSIVTTDTQPWMSDSFWTTGGGAIEQPTLTTGEDLYIRGGAARVQFLNVDAQTAFITVWHVRTTANGTAPLTGSFGSMWDPSMEVDFQEKYRVVSKKQFSLQVGESMTVEKKIRTQKLDVDAYNAGHARDHWYYGIQTMESGQSTQVQIVRSFNLSFTPTG